MIDLDELERKARGATPGPWRHKSGEAAVYCDRGRDWRDPQIARTRTYPEDNPNVISVHSMTVGKREREVDNADFIAAIDPDVTIALIARIRELEAGLTEAVRYIGLAQDPKDDALVCSDFRVLVAKGIP